jgi:hypothetical protein
MSGIQSACIQLAKRPIVSGLVSWLGLKTRDDILHRLRIMNKLGGQAMLNAAQKLSTTIQPRTSDESGTLDK